MSRRQQTSSFAVLVTLGIALVTSCGYFVSPRGPSLSTGALAPSFSLEDQTGRPVTLDDLTRRGPAVVVFYRGYW